MQKLILLLVLWSLWYLAFATRTIVSPLLPIIEVELGINHTMAGALYLFAAAGATVASLMASTLSLKMGLKRLVISSFLITACACFGIYCAKSYLSLAFFLFFFGLGGGFYLPCAVPMITSIFTPNTWGRAISVHETAAGFSVFSIPILVAFGLGYIEWRLLFVLLACFTLAITIFFWFLAPATKVKSTDKTGFVKVIHRTDFWIILILWVNCGMTSMGVYNIVPIFLVDEKGMDLDYANNLFGISRVGGFIGQAAIGLFLDRFSTKRIMLYLVLFSGISTLAMAITHIQWLFIGFMLLQGTFSTVFFPVGLMAISKLTDFEERTTWTGAIMAISQITGVGLTPLVLGAIADAWSFRAGLVILGIFTICLCPIFKKLKEI